MQVLVPAHIIERVTRELQTLLPDSETVPLNSRDAPPANDAEILLRFFPNAQYPGRVFDASVLRRVVAASPRLRWIHNGTTGMDGVLYPQLVASEIVVTNGSGAHRHALAESALGMMLAWAKRSQEHQKNQEQRRWRHLPHGTLRGKTALIAGLGSVGVEIARLCQAFGMHTVGIKRRPNVESPLTVVSRAVGPTQLRKLLPEADYVIVAAALTDETRGMIGEAELRLMKREAYFVNIARGEIVDEAALITALSEGWIAGAGLDVFAQEPLAPSSPFWAMTNVIVTPHNAAWSAHVEEEALAIFYENFRRYISDRPLLNVVDKEAGY